MFFAYLFSIRERHQDYLFCMGRLFQELIIFARIIMDNSRLMWQLTHQKEMRAEKYCSLRQEVDLRRREGLDVEATAGKRVVLGSSFQGGPRMWNVRYQNGMAIVRHFGKPDLFITYTFPPDTPELLAELQPGQTAQVLIDQRLILCYNQHEYQDRPDLVARLFELRKNLLLNEIIKGGLFGRIVGHISVVEYQVCDQHCNFLNHYHSLYHIFCRRGVFLIVTSWGFCWLRIDLILRARLTLQSPQRSHLIPSPTHLALPEIRLPSSSGWS